MRYSWAESQNGGDWKGPLEVVLSSCPAREGPPRAACPGPCSGSFRTSARMEMAQPLCVPCASAQSSLQWKKCFLMFRRNLLFLSLCPLPVVLSLGTTGKSLAATSCTLPSEILIHWWDFHLSLLCSRLKSLRSHNVSCCGRCSNHSIVALWILSSSSISVSYWGQAL